MVWGCFWEGRLGPLVTLTCNVNQDKYIDCLTNKFLPWYQERTGKELIFQENGAPCHTGGYAAWQHRAQISTQSSIFGLILRISLAANVTN
ncbi:uncharacterized protein BYT42DRAFT_631712 [Radiomyces spectabilis]|uniref:uncharacterized protein n=1 Tax=Radiomyces spectabilis TaxID=64574 RepID=UPI00221EF424|nr:uncharacterized protein BYT42DRAFT_631712 [Radiomyces spectabilis]KAI8388619.1 hypothetical protein BYT42DRAFT_631712 [Radiomyces spectabilis]